MLPQATYVPRFDADWWTLIENPPLWSALSATGTVVADWPSETVDSGYAGFGLGFAHVPGWMCAGSCEPAGMPFKAMTTCVLSPALVSVAVPVWFEPPIACIGTTTAPGGGALFVGGAASDARRGSATKRMAKSTTAMVERFIRDLRMVGGCTDHLPARGTFTGLDAPPGRPLGKKTEGEPRRSVIEQALVHIRVVGAGFGRTGTMSMKHALELLGFGPCYHMIEVVNNLGHERAWHAASHGGSLDWSVFDGYRSIVDWPAVHYWRDLIERFPQAKVVLTVRDGESWYKSVTDTIYGRISQPVPHGAPEIMRIHREMTRKIVLENTFGGRFTDKKHAIGVYERHNDDVRRAVEPSRLLVYSVKEGWEPLCDFLGVPIPDEPFPRVNDTASFLQWVADEDEEATERS